MIIFGTGGFAKQLLPVLEEKELLNQCIFYDDISPVNDSYIHRTFNVIRTESDLLKAFHGSERNVIIGVGGPENRKQITKKILQLGGNLHSLIAENAKISSIESSIGLGTCILHDVVIEPCVQIGESCLINLRVTITHDCVIGKYAEISPGAILLGGAYIGESCFIGAGALILPKVRIGDNCVIGAGAVVNKSLPDNSKVAGVPARHIGT